MTEQFPQLHLLFTPATAVPRGDGSFVLTPGKPLVEMTPKMAARALGISPQLIYRQIEEGVFEHVRRPAKRKIWLSAEEVAERYQKTFDPELWERNTKKKCSKKTK